MSLLFFVFIINVFIILRHPYPGFNYQYRYRFYAPWHDTYEESFASFTTEKLEHYNWNYLDHYVCTGGDTEFVLVDALKYWRLAKILFVLYIFFCSQDKINSNYLFQVSGIFTPTK